MQAAKITIIGLIVLVSLFLGFLGYQYIQILNTPVQASTETTTSQKTTTSTTGSGSTSQSTTSGTTSTTTGTSGTTSGTASTTTPTTTSSAKTTTGTTSTTGSGSTTTGTTSGTSQKTSTTSGTTSTSSAGSTTTSGFYKDGVYTGNGNGKTQGMKVQVVVSGGKINGVSVLTSRDDQPYLNEAISGMASRIIAAQSTAVDTISGATLSSKGILQGAAAALAKAK